MQDKASARSSVEWIESVAFAVAVLVVIFLFFFRVVTVSGDSMLPGLVSGDRLIVRSIGYTPQRGDVVVVDSYTEFEKPVVKRVIAVAGDKVDIDFTAGVVYVNDEPLQEDYVSSLTTRAGKQEFPIVVPDGCVFLLGDNRVVSYDCRDVGVLNEKDIMGKAIFRVLPFSKAGVI